ncbi:adenylate/guanylate cyclase domain-containing protein [Mycobacterium talmoniae]|uniref:Adenylate cyclase n=1 Tax=Mycobacterium talmoniae TaxID=1858794 RepID=A0A2S8BPF2_9MYCO|nr:Adenylate cyclase [Mycobacterium talmoniae]
MIRRGCAASVVAESPYRRSHCVPARTQHWAEGSTRRMRVLKITAWIGATITTIFGVMQLFTGNALWWIGLINLATAVIFAVTPKLYKYGELVGPLTFIGVAYVAIFVIAWAVGTGAGAQFYFLVSATLVVLILGVEHIVLAASLAALGAALTIVLQFLAPTDTGAAPAWAQTVSFVFTIISSCVMVVATVWYTLRETARAEAAMEAEYERSEALLANMLPASIAERLKDPARAVIADKYDDASILFADIADFTENASDTTPADLVRFLDLLYTDFDLIAEKHRLEKVKTSGDSYMVVSGVPIPRPDHLDALANLALDMAEAVAVMQDPHGRPLRIRIGLAAGPVVAGVVGTRRFFYDVWGDAVNVASRMESTDTAGRIQVPQDVYERLRHAFVFEERGDVAVKGKGIMHTWYLTGRRPAVDTDGRRPEVPHRADAR